MDTHFAQETEGQLSELFRQKGHSGTTGQATHITYTYYAPYISFYQPNTRFNIQQSYVLPTQCIYVFCVNIRTNSDYFPIQQ
jgi:hypothetical protein